MTELVPETYDEYKKHNSESNFTDWLQKQAEPEWTRMLEHKFVNEMSNGTIDDDVFEQYLIQEHAFVKSVVSVLGYAVGKAPSFEEKRHLVEVLYSLTTDQIGYFERAFESFEVPSSQRHSPELANGTRRLQDLVIRAATTGEFEEVLAPMAAAEWLYLTWSQNVDESSNRPFIDEWIDIHVTEEFKRQSQWFREQLDKYGPQLPSHREQRVKYLFCETVKLEIEFHSSVYK